MRTDLKFLSFRIQARSSPLVLIVPLGLFIAVELYENMLINEQCVFLIWLIFGAKYNCMCWNAPSVSLDRLRQAPLLLFYFHSIKNET